MSGNQGEQLQAQLDAARETIKALSRRMRQLEGSQSQLPFQNQLQSYQRRIAEKAIELEKAESWSELIIEHSMDAIVRLDQQGHIQSWNPMAEQMFGYRDCEILGQLIEDTLLPKRLHEAHLSNFHRHLKRGRGALMNRRLDGMAMRKDGSEIPVEFVGSMVKQGNDVAYAMVFRDIRERKAAEKKLHDSHRNLEALVEERANEVHDLASIIEVSLNLVSMADMQGNLMYINPAGRSMLGLSLDAPLDGLEIEQFHSPETNQMLARDVFPQAIKYGIFEFECEFLDQNAGPIPAACTLMYLPGTQGGDRTAVIARDLRKEIALQQQVEHVDRLESLGVLAGGIAHDFNNILTAIIGNASLAKRKLDSVSPGYEHLQRIEESSLQAANLCKQMLAYSGKGEFVVQPVSLSRLIDEMGSLLQMSVDKSVILKFDLADALALVDADVTQMQQVLMNLVINASEAMDGRNGTISVSTGIMHVDETDLQNSSHQPGIATGDFAYLEVSDSGSGMDAFVQKKIFDPFFTTKFTGRGLGMSAVLGIVHGHHGLLKLDSEPGKGTTFRIALPLSAASDTSVQTEQAINKPETVSGLILIVDDEASIREVASLMLQSMGFDVLSAVDGEDGVRVFRQHPDIAGVLLDMTMPHMNGDACFHELRKINPEIQVVLSSGYNVEDATGRFDGKGLAGFIQKPYRVEHFQKIMAECFK